MSMSAVIPVRFKKEELRLIDELVKSGIFRSRSEAIRLLALKSAEEITLLSTDMDVARVVKAILRSIKENRESLQIVSKKTAAEIIREMREDEDIR